LFVNDFARVDALRVGTTSTDPGDGKLYVEGTSTLVGSVTLGASSADLWVRDGYLCVEDATGGNCAGTTDGYIYADDVVEYSKDIPEGEVLPIIMKMSNNPDGTLNHSSFPSYVSKEVIKDDKPVLAEGISMSSQLKHLIKGVQELVGWNEEQDERLDKNDNCIVSSKDFAEYKKCVK